MHDYWHKQTSDKPLFPDLLWSRPENRAHAGKLLIAGGNAHGFAAAAEAFGEATKAGVGTARVVLPDSLQKTVGRVFPAGEYAPGNTSGGFSRRALAELLTFGQWADGVLLAGDFGRNSETAVVLEQFAAKYSGPLTITKDALDYFMHQPATVTDRPDTVLVASYAQLQKLAQASRFAKAFTFELDFLHVIEQLHEFTLIHPAAIVTQHAGTLFAAIHGQVSTTPYSDEQKIWRVKTAAHCAVWQLQNPGKPFEAISSAIIQSN